ncbi:hypothetical protein ACZ91_48125, partial [Streptomyces regensis]
MHVIVTRDPTGRFSMRCPDADLVVPDDVAAEELPARAERIEREHRPRWVLPSTDRDYRPLLEAGVRVRRCHDLSLVEGLLLAAEGAGDRPRSLAAAYARLRGLPVPADNEPHGPPDDRPALFEPHET